MQYFTPPEGFQSWIDYAVSTMDARSAYLNRIFHDEEIHSPEDIRKAAQEELEQLRIKATMPWARILETWCNALSKRLGRSAEEILQDRLLATDFPDDGVHIKFEDGSELNFRRAFYLGGGEYPTDDSYRSHRVAVFTENCGYHEFWIGPKDLIETIQKPLMANAEFFDAIRKSRSEVQQGMVVPYQFGSASKEDQDWDQMASIGREFGSPDYERLEVEDAIRFASDLKSWINKAEQKIDSEKLDYALREFATEANNVQLALRELGHDVSIEVAAAVWIHYSESSCAGWMMGADTVASAARTLYLKCPKTAA